MPNIKKAKESRNMGLSHTTFQIVFLKKQKGSIR